MSDEFLPLPDQLLGPMMLSQDAVDLLAFGPSERGARASLLLDDQILCAHTAAGTLLIAMWGDDLPAYVRSPSLGTWYRVPALYWGRQTPESMRSAINRPEIPDQLPGQPRPLDPRYGINVATYSHSLPAIDLVGQLVAFRKPEVERYCVTAGPVFEWKLTKREALGDAGTERSPLGSARLREWITAMNREGRSQDYIAKNAAAAFSDFLVPGRPTIRSIDAEVREDLGMSARERGKPRRQTQE